MLFSPLVCQYPGCDEVAMEGSCYCGYHQSIVDGEL